LLLKYISEIQERGSNAGKYQLQLLDILLHFSVLKNPSARMKIRSPRGPKTRNIAAILEG